MQAKTISFLLAAILASTAGSPHSYGQDYRSTPPPKPIPPKVVETTTNVDTLNSSMQGIPLSVSAGVYQTTSTGNETICDRVGYRRSCRWIGLYLSCVWDRDSWSEYDTTNCQPRSSAGYLVEIENVRSRPVKKSVSTNNALFPSKKVKDKQKDCILAQKNTIESALSDADWLDLIKNKMRKKKIEISFEDNSSRAISDKSLHWGPDAGKPDTLKFRVVMNSKGACFYADEQKLSEEFNKWAVTYSMPPHATKHVSTAAQAASDVSGAKPVTVGPATTSVSQPSATPAKKRNIE